MSLSHISNHSTELLDHAQFLSITLTPNVLTSRFHFPYQHCVAKQTRCYHSYDTTRKQTTSKHQYRSVPETPQGRYRQDVMITQ